MAVKKPRKHANPAEVTRPHPLGAKHFRAIALLVAGWSYEDTARAVGVDVATLRDWRRRPDFRERLEEAQGEVIEHAERKARALVTKAFGVLDRAMDLDGDDAPTSIHIAAAKEVLSRVVPEKRQADVTHHTPDLADALREAIDRSPEALAAYLDALPDDPD